MVVRKRKHREGVREFGTNQIMKVLGSHCEDILAFTFSDWEAIESLEETSIRI